MANHRVFTPADGPLQFRDRLRRQGVLPEQNLYRLALPVDPAGGEAPPAATSTAPEADPQECVIKREDGGFSALSDVDSTDYGESVSASLANEILAENPVS